MILKGVELAGNAPESGPDLFPPFEDVGPNFQRQVAGRIAGVRFAERLALLRPSLAHGSHSNHQPHFFGEWKFRNRNVALHFEVQA